LAIKKNELTAIKGTQSFSSVVWLNYLILLTIRLSDMYNNNNNNNNICIAPVCAKKTSEVLADRINYCD